MSSSSFTWTCHGPLIMFVNSGKKILSHPCHGPLTMFVITGKKMSMRLMRRNTIFIIEITMEKRFFHTHGPLTMFVNTGKKMSRRLMGRKTIFSFIIEIISFTTFTTKISFLF